MDNLFQIAASVGGIGGLLAIVVFFMYRQLIGQMREDRKFMENRLTLILNGYQEVVTGNTRALQELTSIIRDLKEYSVRRV